MKQGLFIILFLLITFASQAQRQERQAIKEGNKAYREQLYGEAETKYNEAISVNPSSKEALFNLANTYYKQNKWDEAIEGYKHFLTVEGEASDRISSAWSNMGNALLKKKDLQNSMEAYKNSLRWNPKDEQTRYNLAVVQKMIQDQDKDKDKNKDQDDKDEQEKKDKDKKDQNKQDQQQDKNKDEQNKKDKKPEKEDNQQMSQESAKQILQAIEQDEKETQERVKQMKAQEKKKQNEQNRRQNKDW